MNKRGFTFIELLSYIAILWILMVPALFLYNNTTSLFWHHWEIIYFKKQANIAEHNFKKEIKDALIDNKERGSYNITIDNVEQTVQIEHSYKDAFLAGSTVTLPTPEILLDGKLGRDMVQWTDQSGSGRDFYVGQNAATPEATDTSLASIGYDFWGSNLMRSILPISWTGITEFNISIVASMNSFATNHAFFYRAFWEVLYPRMFYRASNDNLYFQYRLDGITRTITVVDFTATYWISTGEYFHITARGNILAWVELFLNWNLIGSLTTSWTEFDGWGYSTYLGYDWNQSYYLDGEILYYRMDYERFTDAQLEYLNTTYELWGYLDNTKTETFNLYPGNVTELPLPDYTGRGIFNNTSQTPLRENEIGYLYEYTDSEANSEISVIAPNNLNIKELTWAKILYDGQDPNTTESFFINYKSWLNHLQNLRGRSWFVLYNYLVFNPEML